MPLSSQLAILLKSSTRFNSQIVHWYHEHTACSSQLAILLMLRFYSKSNVFNTKLVKSSVPHSSNFPKISENSWTIGSSTAHASKLSANHRQISAVWRTRKKMKLFSGLTPDQKSYFLCVARCPWQRNSAPCGREYRQGKIPVLTPSLRTYLCLYL